MAFRKILYYNLVSGDELVSNVEPATQNKPPSLGGPAPPGGAHLSFETSKIVLLSTLTATY